MSGKTVVLSTTFRGEGFMRNLERIVNPFKTLSSVNRIWCVNEDLQGAQEDKYAVVAFDRGDNQELVRQPVCRNQKLYFGILKLANAKETLDAEVEPESIYLHRIH